MALAHLPNIVTSGLAFYYDMNNTQKSWKGAPTTNLYADGDFSSGALHPVRSGTWQIVSDPRNSAKRVLKATPSAGTQYHGRDITVTISTVYSLQMEVFVSSDFDGTNVQMYPEQGGAGASVAYNLANKGTWQTLKFNGKAATTTNIRMLAYVLTASTTGYVLIANVQVEQSSLATPFVNGTRSNTQSILDLVSNKTITINGLTYNSDGTFGFNGTSDYISSSFSTTSGQAVTYCGWLYSTETTAIYKNFVDSAGVNPMIWWNTSGQIEFDAGQYTTPSVYRNQWVYVALSKPSGSSAASYYVNGNLVGTGSAYTTPAVTPTFFNRAAGQTWKGNCPNVQVYNRALSAAEVKQNFNTLRRRYGI